MNSKIKLSRIDAVQVYDCIKAMTGSASYQLLRQGVLEKIEKTWPEILKTDSPTEDDLVREMEVDPREQRSLAEGFLSLFDRKDNSGKSILTSATFLVVQTACKTCKVWNWVKSQVDKEEIPEFTEGLDDEPPLSDDLIVPDEEVKSEE